MIGKIFSRRIPYVLRTMSTMAKTAGTVTLKIDNKEVTVPKGMMLVEAIKMAGLNVPTMCYHPDLSNSGGICRICLVESAKAPGHPIISCKTPVANGMEILTQGFKMKEYRQANLAMMLAEHPHSCLSCPSNPSCKTQTMAGEVNISECGFTQVTPERNTKVFDRSNNIERDNDRCINCDICVNTCNMIGVNSLAFYNNHRHEVGTMDSLDVSECVQCGQCINRCPTGAITEHSEIKPVLDAINDPSKIVVFQMAPSVRVALAEEFGCKPGEKILKNEIVTAVKKLNSNIVFFDTNFSADLTIIEEGNELIERLYRNVTKKQLLGDKEMPIDLPMFTSCCPGWVTFVEKNYPDMLNNLSTCKSPEGMMGALIKGYWAKNVKNIDPKNVVSVSIMPCTAKKEEKERATLKSDEGYNTVDYVLTTRELAKMLKQSNIDPTRLEKTPFDKLMAEGTGAAVIFGVTGGVMEAALRTAYEVITGRPVPFKDLNITPVRGMEGIREAEIKLEKVLDKYKPFEGVTVKVAIAHGLENARKLMEIVKQAKAEGKASPWHFIEVMTCPGGCIGGGGQPKPTDLGIRKARTELTFAEDMNLPYRKSHENPEIIRLYNEYLKEPLGHNSHHYLHTGYIPKQVRDMITYNVNEAVGMDVLLDKYPREQQYLLPILIEEQDKKGYISDPSVVMIAKHLQMYPAQVDSIISCYHYLTRRHTSDAHAYLCTCHNCMLKGQGKVIRAIQEKYGIERINGVSKDGKFALHTLNWLGYCVNDGPAMMVKRTGTRHVEVITGLTPQNIGLHMQSLSSSNPLPMWPINKIRARSLVRQGNYYSFMNATLGVGEAIRVASQMGPEKVIKEVFDSELVGRGGAGFRTGLKWQSAYREKAGEKYVVCNADEGLPSTYKDWFILNDENKVKELVAGMGICANAIGAKKCYIYLRYEYRNLLLSITQTIQEIQEISPEIAHLKFEVRLGCGPYVAGEENAQFESIQGAAPIPRKNRPYNVFPTIDGLFHKPTVINNVETFAAVPHIVYHGGKSFAEGRLPKLLSVTGDVETPIILESNLNNYTLSHLITEVEAKDIIAAEVGGSTEPLLFYDKFDDFLGFGRNRLNAVGSVVLFNATCDLAEIYESKLRFMADESCKQCVPCRDGSKLFYNAFRDLRTKGSTGYNMTALRIAAESASKSSICAHGKSLDALFTAACDYMKVKKPVPFM